MRVTSRRKFSMRQNFAMFLFFFVVAYLLLLLAFYQQPVAKDVHTGGDPYRTHPCYVVELHCG